MNLLLSYTDPYTAAWGGYGEYQANNLDTALAIQALKTSNYPDLSVMNYALAYLSGSQNADGALFWTQTKSSEQVLAGLITADPRLILIFIDAFSSGLPRLILVYTAVSS